MDSFALMWFGLQRGTAQSDTFSQRAELLSLSVCSSCVFKQTNQHHSAVLACLSPPAHNLCSQCVCTKLPALFHTHTCTHYYLYLQTPIDRQSLSALIAFFSPFCLFTNLLPPSHLCLVSVFANPHL